MEKKKKKIQVFNAKKIFLHVLLFQNIIIKLFWEKKVTVNPKALHFLLIICLYKSKKKP